MRNLLIIVLIFVVYVLYKKTQQGNTQPAPGNNADPSLSIQQELNKWVEWINDNPLLRKEVQKNADRNGIPYEEQVLKDAYEYLKLNV